MRSTGPAECQVKEYMFSVAHVTQPSSVTTQLCSVVVVVVYSIGVRSSSSHIRRLNRLAASRRGGWSGCVRACVCGPVRVQGSSGPCPDYWPPPSRMPAAPWPLTSRDAHDVTSRDARDDHARLKRDISTIQTPRCRRDAREPPLPTVGVRIFGGTDVPSGQAPDARHAPPGLVWTIALPKSARRSDKLGPKCPEFSSICAEGCPVPKFLETLRHRCRSVSCGSELSCGRNGRPQYQ